MGRVGFELVCLYFERDFLAYFDDVLFCLTDCQVYALPLYSVSGRRLNSWRLVECQKCQSWIGGSIDIAKTCLSDILV